MSKDHQPNLCMPIAFAYDPFPSLKTLRMDGRVISDEIRQRKWSFIEFIYFNQGSNMISNAQVMFYLFTKVILIDRNSEILYLLLAVLKVLRS